MPTYIFRDDATGETVEQVYPVTSVPESVTVGNAVYKRDAMAEILTQHRQVRENSRYIVKHPHKKICSDAMGVLPSQIPEALADAKSRGVKIEFDSEGTAMWNSRKERKDYCRAIGAHDRDGGYGDP